MGAGNGRSGGVSAARLLAALTAAMLLGLLTALAAAAHGGTRSTGGGGVAPTSTTTTATTTTTTTTTTTPTSTTPTPPPVPSYAGNPFGGRAMWIWYLSASDGGDIPSIINRAHQDGISTLIVKSSDGSTFWSQFTPAMIQAFHAAHIRVCAWQYVYGNHPATEAEMGAQAVAAGADCLVIDAESEYEGKYISAQTYMADLRGSIGGRYPLVLAGFPYVDYHPAFPYSVFLGPGGAQWNAPQMYWKDIGLSVDTVFAHTFVFNRPYGRPILPLGQTYTDPAPAQIRRFRQESRAYGSPGVSWWDYQETTGRGWRALSQPVGSMSNFKTDPYLVTLQSGMHGDLVVWAQEHLRGAGEPLTINGSFDRATRSAVLDFQSTHGLSSDGLLGTQTWTALLHYPPVKVQWMKEGRKTVARAARADALPVPASASLRGRNELHGEPGRGTRR